MVAEAKPPTVREAVAVFDDAAQLEEAIDDLLSSGFDRAEISLLASEHAVEEKLGHLYRKTAELEDEPNAARTAYVSTEAIGDAQGAIIGGLTYVGAVAAAGAIVASGGTLAGAIIGASLAGGASGLVASVLADLVGRHHAAYLNEQLEHGGLLLWVRTWNAELESKACEVLKRHSGKDVHVHELPASTVQPSA